MEAVAEQLSKTGFQEGAARLKALPPAEFEDCFSRFQGDELNYWNDRKQMQTLGRRRKADEHKTGVAK